MRVNKPRFTSFLFFAFLFYHKAEEETETEIENYITDPFLLMATLLLFFFDALNAFVRSIRVGHTVCITSEEYALVGKCGWLDRILKLSRRIERIYLLARETMNYSTSGTISRQTCQGIYLRERHAAWAHQR